MMMMMIVQTQVSSRKRNAVQPVTRFLRFIQVRLLLVFPALME